ncbi:hypothetical protein [Sulfitobacter sp. D7]|uniref:hypothetical protein n=1 Tax=Sulfitobacter sp. D7 TaxID=1968541 RepID=UPI000E77C4F7|nr:hypothetical protein [Sulfitobacter sp. D7]AYE88248.1 hypothetical protein B5M07_18725 [Sulfitobacter sp. D7]
MAPQAGSPFDETHSDIAVLRTLLSFPLPASFIDACSAKRAERGFVPLDMLFATLPAATVVADAQDHARSVARMFNGSNATHEKICMASRSGDQEAANLKAWLSLNGICPAPVHVLPAERAQALEQEMLPDPAGYLARADRPYPYSVNEQHWGFDIGWVNALLERGRTRLERFAATRQRDVAVLVGNGPSLKQTDLSLLHGHDVYISNYAVNHPTLSAVARGVAVSNYFVAEQAPEVFFDLPYWRVLPVGLSHVLRDDENTIWLNALGGPLFFSETPQTHIAWHATVSFFWLQVLLAVGYRKVLLIGVDNSYRQPNAVREGTLLRQAEDDENHFDPGYFRGKLWQAADTDHMARTYELAKSVFEAAGAEIVNCTVGGALESFRRAPLGQEL